MTYEQIVAFAKKKVTSAKVKKFNDFVAAQVNITGEGEGAFYIKADNGTVEIEPYTYDDKNILYVASADVFTAVLDGKKDAVAAVEAGELKIEYDYERGLAFLGLFKAAAKKAPAKKATTAKKAPAAKKETVKKAPAKKATTAKKAEAKPAAKAVAKKTVSAPSAEAKTKAVATAKKAVAKKTTK